MEAVRIPHDKMEENLLSGGDKIKEFLEGKIGQSKKTLLHVNPLVVKTLKMRKYYQLL